MQHNNDKLTLKISALAMLTGLSLVLVSVVNFPIFPAAAFLKYDPADIPILICTFIFGPWAGLTVTLIVSLVQSLIVGDFPYGFLMHFIATGVLVITLGLIYRRKKTFKTALAASGIGIVVWVITMVLANLLITPFYTGMPVSGVAALLLPAIIPFNLIKSVINCGLTLLLYKKSLKLFCHILKTDTDEFVGVTTDSKKTKNSETDGENAAEELSDGGNANSDVQAVAKKEEK